MAKRAFVRGVIKFLPGDNMKVDVQHMLKSFNYSKQSLRFYIYY